MDDAGFCEDADANLVDSASLENVSLIESSFNSVVAIHTRRRDGVDRSVDAVVDESNVAKERLIGEVECSVHVMRKAGNLTGVPGGPATGAVVFSLGAVYAVAFQISGRHDKETIDGFFGRMAPFTVWPYFRAHVAITAAAADVEVPILPLRKLVHGVETVTALDEQPITY